MTGPEHYREAEQLLGARRSGETAEDAASRLAEAHIHATLALAAATAFAQPADDDAHRAWQRATGELPEPEPRRPRQRPQPVPHEMDIEVGPPKTTSPRRSRDYDSDTDM
jgi:hypothetical protein